MPPSIPCSAVASAAVAVVACILGYPLYCPFSTRGCDVALIHVVTLTYHARSYCIRRHPIVLVNQPHPSSLANEMPDLKALVNDAGRAAVGCILERKVRLFVTSRSHVTTLSDTKFRNHIREYTNHSGNTPPWYTSVELCTRTPAVDQPLSEFVSMKRYPISRIRPRTPMVLNQPAAPAVSATPLRMKVAGFSLFLLSFFLGVFRFIFWRWVCTAHMNPC